MWFRWDNETLAIASHCHRAAAPAFHQLVFFFPFQAKGRALSQAKASLKLTKGTFRGTRVEHVSVQLVELDCAQHFQ